jgi:hypothetical protein
VDLQSLTGESLNGMIADSSAAPPTWQDRVAYVAQQVAGKENYFVTADGNVVAENPNVSLSPPNDKKGDSTEEISRMSPPYPLSQTFLLHSLPGAKYTIYLDFNGHTTSGTAWNTDFTSGNPITTPAYSFEGGSNFSDAELERIQKIWERVSEDFIPFNVNVTTQEPALSRLIRFGEFDEEWGVRVVIGTENWYPGAPGGVAYVGSFNWSSDTPAFVFTNGVGTGEKSVSEAISHEVGHTLGLYHDGTASTEYYAGHGSGATGWAPIMGVGYNRELTQWSRGEYPGATNTEDDLLVITLTGGNGVSYRTDTHGDTRTTATPLSIAGSTASGSGIIERTWDVDFFSFSTGGGNVTLNINPFYRSPNLDILARLYNSSGIVVATSNPTSALNASFNLSLTPGTYYLSVDGIGLNGLDNDFGYSDYGSLGFYSIEGTIPPSRPDLVGWWSDVQASEVKWGQSFQVRGQVQNLGNIAATTPFYQDFFLSKNQVWGDSDDTLLGWHYHTASVPAFGLGPEFFITLTLPATPPAGFQGSGTLYIGMKSDALNALVESNETNNGPGVFAITYDWDSFIAPPPDLIGGHTEILQPNGLSAPKSSGNKDDQVGKQGGPSPSVVLKWGDSFQVKTQVGNFNTGPGGASTWVTAPFDQSFILSNDFNWGDADDITIGWFEHVDRVGIVGPYNYVTLTLPSSPPAGYEGQGPFYLGMKTDAFNEISETDETNNGPGWWGEDLRTYDFDWFSIEETTPATVAGQFAYHSIYTGSGSRLDTGKIVAREGATPQNLSYQNLINTSAGITGLVLDINDLASSSLTAADFVFQMSPQGVFDEGANPPSSWVTAPSPSNITVTSGSPNRILLQWPNNVIQNRWLRVTMLANSSTGLQQNEVFYLGHLLGETTGESGGAYTVSFSDITPIRSAVGNTVDASSHVDIDKNGTVAFGDISAMRPSVGQSLKNITIPAASIGGGGEGSLGFAPTNPTGGVDSSPETLVSDLWQADRRPNIPSWVEDKRQDHRQDDLTDFNLTIDKSQATLVRTRQRNADTGASKISASQWLFGMTSDWNSKHHEDEFGLEVQSQSLQLVDSYFEALD